MQRHRRLAFTLGGILATRDSYLRSFCLLINCEEMTGSTEATEDCTGTAAIGNLNAVQFTTTTKQKKHGAETSANTGLKRHGKLCAPSSSSLQLRQHKDCHYNKKLWIAAAETVCRRQGTVYIEKNAVILIALEKCNRPKDRPNILLP